MQRRALLLELETGTCIILWLHCIPCLVLFGTGYVAARTIFAVLPKDSGSLICTGSQYPYKWMCRVE